MNLRNKLTVFQKTVYKLQNNALSFYLSVLIIHVDAIYSINHGTIGYFPGSARLLNLSRHTLKEKWTHSS